MSKPGNEVAILLQNIREEKAAGDFLKRFEDDYFALDLLKILYDDAVDSHSKAELLVALEEYGATGITADSVDQIVTSLLDIFNQSVENADQWVFICQTLITCTNLIIQLDQFKSGICDTLVKDLVAIVTSRINQPDSQRLRSCACQCLIHLEEFHPGLLSSHIDDFAQLCRQERCHVFQDYALLAAKVLEHAFVAPESPSSNSGNLQNIHRLISYEPQNVRQTAAYLIENVPMYTTCGSFRIMRSLTQLVKQVPDISPMIFKPLMLRQMSTMCCVVFHTVLYLQRVFQDEILTMQEEADLLHRLCLITDHPALNVRNRQLAIHWVRMYKQDENHEPFIPDYIIRNHRLKFFPSVFDSVDLQLGKLYMTALCGNTTNDTEGFETSILLASLGCLHKLVWHTGSADAAKSLFRALYYIYKHHNNQFFSKDIQRFVRGLISEFPHFIPNSIDFVDSVHNLNVDSEIFVETLSLLHQQVVMATEEQIYESFHFYLHIMKKSAAQTEIDQISTLKFLSYLAENSSTIDDSSWKLGHGILEVCRNIMICHGTDFYYTEMGDLLYYMKTSYGDTDVQDLAQMYYALITGAVDQKVKKVLQTTVSDIDTMNKALTSLLPGNVDTVNLAKVIYLEEQIFKWERIGVNKSLVVHGDGADVRQSKEFQGATDIQMYIQYINNITITVDVTCRLALQEHSDFAKVFAVTVHVYALDTTVDSIPDTSVACLCKGSDAKNIVIKLKLKQPLPQTLTGCVKFLSDLKQTYSVTLAGVDIKFCDFMLPLPWKPKCDTEQFFLDLWKWVLDYQEGNRKGIESVKLLDIDQDKLTKLRNKLAIYQLGLDGDDNKSCYAILLPPHYHILLKCQAHEDNILLVSIATDLWTLLQLLDKFLQSIIS